MRIINLLIIIIAVFASSSHLAYATGEGPPITLRVKYPTITSILLGDDGGHMYMPKLLTSSRDTSIRFDIQVEDPEPEPGNWSLAGYYSLSSKNWAGVGMNRLTTIEEFLNIKRLNLDISAFAGAGVEGTTLAGFAGTMDVKIGKKLYFSPGLGVDGNLADLRTLGFGFIFAIKYNF